MAATGADRAIRCLTQLSIGTGLGLSSSDFQFVDPDGKTKVGGDGGLHRQNAADAPLPIQQGPAAIARFERDGELDHRSLVNFAPARNDPRHDAVAQPLRIAERHDRLPLRRSSSESPKGSGERPCASIRRIARSRNWSEA